MSRTTEALVQGRCIAMGLGPQGRKSSMASAIAAATVPDSS